MLYASDIYGNREPIYLPDEKSIQAWQVAMLARISGLESEREEVTVSEEITYDSPAFLQAQMDLAEAKIRHKGVMFAFNTAKVLIFGALPVEAALAALAQVVLPDLIWLPILLMLLTFIGAGFCMFNVWERIVSKDKNGYTESNTSRINTCRIDLMRAESKVTAISQNPRFIPQASKVVEIIDHR